MVTADGRVKVLDFGLAKLVERPAAEATMSALAPTPGIVVGTAAYMSPEQAQGRPVDARSDVFSFGVVLYEMLTGQRPFAGTSSAALISAILRDEPRADAQREAGGPRRRRGHRRARAGEGSSGALRRRRRHARRPRRRACATDPPGRLRLAPARRARARGAALLVAAAAFGVWQMNQVRRARWARLEAIPEIERMNLSGRTMHAVRLARAAEPLRPGGIARVRQGWLDVHHRHRAGRRPNEMKNYQDMSGDWEPVGPTPVRVRLPFAYYRVRVTKPGYKTLEVSATLARTPVKLTPEADVAPGMVFVPGGPFQVGAAPPVTLPDYWIDQLEVTNAAFKQFVDAGGYREAKYWTEPFSDGIACCRSTKRWRASAMRPAAGPLDVGAGQLSRRSGRFSGRLASAGSKRRRTRHSPAKAFRRCITGSAPREPTSPTPTSCS